MFSNEPKIKFNQGILLEQLGNDSEAIKKYEEITPGSSVYAKAQINLGLILKKQVAWSRRWNALGNPNRVGI